MTPLQLPLLNQIPYSLLGKKGAEVLSPPRDARNVTDPHLVGWHRYTRWTGRLSHHASNLSHPCNSPPKGCDPCFTKHQVQGEEVVVSLVAIR